MNLDNDYDNDGNNIVPCPICLSIHCLSKEDGKCPEEDMFAIEGEIRLLLDEYRQTGDNSRIVNVLEAVEKVIQTTRKEAIKECEGCVPKAISDCESCNDCEAMMSCPRKEAHNSCREQTLQAISKLRV